MNRNCIGSIYWMFFIRTAHFIPIRWQTWPPRAILIYDWLISIKASSLKPLCQMTRNLVGSIYVRSSIQIANFVPIHLQTWPPQAILVSDWLISKKKSSPLKPLCQMNWNMVGSIYEQSSMTFAHFVLICWQTWPPQAILVSVWSISKNVLLWKCLAKWTESLQEISMEGPL
jgi:hypothetical protein